MQKQKNPKQNQISVVQHKHFLQVNTGRRYRLSLSLSLFISSNIKTPTQAEVL